MPYSNLKDLPDHLPKHAQEIYKEAYNSAWDKYKSPKDRNNENDREGTSHAVAWSAVKKNTKKAMTATGTKSKVQDTALAYK